MLVPVCDRPPIRTDAILTFMKEQALPKLHLGGTIRLPTNAVRNETRPRRTNRTPDLSIARARIDSIAQEARSELDRYARFVSGWDGYSAEPIAPAALMVATTLIDTMVDVPIAVQKLTEIIPGPAPDGSLDLELRTDKRRLIITMYAVDDDRGLDIRTFRTDGVTSEEKNNLELDALVPDLRWLLA